MASKPITLKLLIDNKSKKVLFAESGKDFVDFVFSLLALPLDAVVKLLSADAMQGSIGRLYESVVNIDDTYILPNKGKAELLAPRVHFAYSGNLLRLQGSPESSCPNLRLFTCPCKCPTASTDPYSLCPKCSYVMHCKVELTTLSASTPVQAASSSDGSESSAYVRGVVTYMVSDNLEVTPMSAISSITLVNKYCVSRRGCELAEKVVSLGMDEGLAFLKAALKSETVLTDVFLTKSRASRAN